MKKLVLLLFVSLFMLSCTQNQRARNFGGDSTVYLPEGKKLVNVSWKEDDLWYLVRDRQDGESIETYQLIEDSSYGVLSGTVTLQEK